MKTVMAGLALAFLAQSALARDAKPSDVYLGYDGDGRKIELFMRGAPISLVQTLPGCVGKFFAVSSKGEDEHYGCWQKQADTIAIEWTQGYKVYPAAAFYLR